MKHGYGSQWKETGKKYEGEFFENKIDGQGTLYWRDGGLKYYQGQWKQGKRQGEGTVFDQDGRKVYKGHFEQDVASG